MLQRLSRYLQRLKNLPFNAERIVQEIDKGTIHAVYLGDHQLLVRLFTGHYLYVDSRDVSITPHLIKEGILEPEVMRVWERLIRENMTVFDVGANVGYFGLVAGDRAANITVHYFEANPDLIALLEKTITINGAKHRSRLTHAAASDQSGALLTLYRFKDQWGGTSVHPTVHDFPIVGEFQVDSLALDDYYQRNRIERVDVVKIDVEGHEEKVYAGMRIVIAQNPQLKILMEYTFGAYSDAFLPQLHANFASVRAISSTGRLVAVPTENEMRKLLQPWDTFATLLLENGEVINASF